MMNEKKRVLILCTGNSARSQMTEGLLRHDAGDRFEVSSAGVEPRFTFCCALPYLSIELADTQREQFFFNFSKRSMV